MPEENEFTSERHVYEPHTIGLPPLGPYVRELWRRREFALEMARTNLRAQHFNTAFGLLWLVLNPLLLAGVYFMLRRHPAARARAASSSSRTCWPGCSPTTSSRTRSGCRSSPSRAAGG